MYLVDACMSPSLGAIPAARWTRLHGTIWVWQPLLSSNLLPASDSDPELSDNTGSEVDAPDAADGQSEAWIRLTDIPPQLHTIMVSQFADLRWPSSITDATALADLEMLHADLERARSVPVALAFGRPGEDPNAALAVSPGASGASETTALLVAQPLPPPTLGEIALVAVDGSWIPISLGDLGDQGAELQQRLSTHLTDLARPAAWTPFSDLLASCAFEGAFERQRRKLETSLLATPKRDRAAIEQDLTALQEAWEQLQTLRAERDRVAQEHDLWARRLHEAASLARELARAYWQHWQTARAPVRIARSGPPVAAEALAAPSLLQPELPFVQVPAALPVHAVLAAYSNAQSGATRWSSEGGLPRFVYDREVGTAFLQLRPPGAGVVLDETVLSSLWQQVRRLNDLDGDIFLLALAKVLLDPPDENGNVRIESQEILRVRGIQPMVKRDAPHLPKRSAGYRHEDLARIAECVTRMSNTWITVRQAIEEYVVGGPGRRKRRRRRLHTLESPLLVVAQVHRQRELRDDETPNDPATEQSMPVAWHYKMGTWLAPFLQAPNRRIAYFVQQALQYDPIRHYWAKRLARYFILNMTMRPGEEGGTLTRQVSGLLNELSLPHSERRPQEAKDKFEKALNKLKEDGLISAWSYAESEADLPKREWFWIWLEWHVQVWGMPVQVLATTSETSETSETSDADKDAPPTA